MNVVVVIKKHKSCVFVALAVFLYGFVGKKVTVVNVKFAVTGGELE